MATHESVWVQVTIPEDKTEEFLKVCRAALPPPGCHFRGSTAHATHSRHASPHNSRQVMETDCLESRKEEGCTRFDLLRDKANPAVFYFYETYVSADAAALHKTLPHYKLWADFKAANPSIGPTQSVIKADSLFA